MVTGTVTLSPCRNGDGGFSERSCCWALKRSRSTSSSPASHWEQLSVRSSPRSGAPVLAQVLAAVGTALLSLFLLRPIGVRLLRTDGGHTNVDALIGAHALVMERVDTRTGRVKVSGEIWSARARRPGIEFQAGTDVVVTSIDGATAVVDEQQGAAGLGAPTSGTTGE